MSFDAFMRKVDVYLVRMVGMPSDCLPDYCYHDSWKSGETPKDCAEQAVEYARDSF